MYPPSKLQTIRSDKYAEDNVVISHSIRTDQQTSIPFQHEIDLVLTENYTKQNVASETPATVPEIRHERISPTTDAAKPTISSIPHQYNGTLSFWPSESGLGNNLYGLASAFLIATLTNKKLFSEVL